MKLSNVLLTVVAVSVVALATLATAKITNVTPTSVISVPFDEDINGGGFNVTVPKNLSSRQAHLLAMAYEIAKHDGHKYPQILQGIILQESRAGMLSIYKVAGQEYGLRPNDRYYGVAQIKLGATKDVLSRYPSMKKEFGFQTTTDEEIIAKLIENDRFNLAVASKYLLILKSYGYNTIKELALAYNQGPGGAKDHDEETHEYSIGVMKHIQELKVAKK